MTADVKAAFEAGAHSPLKVTTATVREFARENGFKDVAGLTAALNTTNNAGGLNIRGKTALTRFINESARAAGGNRKNINEGHNLARQLRKKVDKRIELNRKVSDAKINLSTVKADRKKERQSRIEKAGLAQKAREDKGFKTEILQYPMNSPLQGWGLNRDSLDAERGQGHYIIFYINASAGPQSQAANRSLINAQSDVAKAQAELAKDRGEKPGEQNVYNTFIDGATKIPSVKFGSGRDDITLTQGRQVRAVPAINRGANANASASLYGGKGDSFIGNSIRLPTAIALYMPNQVQATYNLNYADDEAGALATGLAEVFRGMSGGESSLTGGQFTRMAQGATLKALETAAPGAKNALSVQTGKILNNKMELAFKGIGRRKFNFTFTFTPHSRDEAKMIDTIVARFKFHSHPEFIKESKGLMMTIPDTFDMHYMYQSAENSFLNKISTCFLTAINVQYGGDRYTAHAAASNHMGASGSPPTKTILTMEFQELETITRERISEGY